MSRSLWKAIIGTACLIGTPCAAEPQKQDPLYHGSMGYLKDGMEHIRQKDVRLALELWIGELLQRKNIKTDIFYYDDVDESIENFRQFRHDMLMVNTFFYLREEARIDPIAQPYVWVIQHGPRPFEQMVLLVRRDSGIASLKSLENTRLAMRGDYYTGRLFLDREMLEATHRSYEKVFGETEMTKTHSLAVLQTFFGKVDACVVPRYILEMVSEMNPAVMRDLVVLHESEPIFVPYVGAFHKQTPEKMTIAYADFVEELSRTPKGQNILDLFKMQAMVRMPSEALEPMRRYFREYTALQRRYVPSRISR
jgi:ABC-type phosphate/phosphonate transport system substrate-binding protein